MAAAVLSNSSNPTPNPPLPGVLHKPQKITLHPPRYLPLNPVTSPLLRIPGTEYVPNTIGASLPWYAPIHASGVRLLKLPAYSYRYIVRPCLPRHTVVLLARQTKISTISWSTRVWFGPAGTFSSG